MKQYIYLILSGSMFFLMLIFPSETFSGASTGLLLWFQTLLPTLLPFMIVSNLLIHTNGVAYISKLLHPFLSRIFRVSPSGCYAILVGFLCGYPMGAKVIADLVETERISRHEGQYLLSFCNNTSPMFIISYVVTQHFQDQSLLFPTLLILFTSPILCSFLFRNLYKIPKNRYNGNNSNSGQIRVDFTIFDNSIMNGFENITKVGGYVILFSILFTLCEPMPFPALLAFLEISNGIPCLANGTLPFEISYVLCLALVSFGGLCSIAQTYSMIQDAKLSILRYTKEKLITAMVTSLLAYIYILSSLQ